MRELINRSFLIKYMQLRLRQKIKLSSRKSVRKPRKGKGRRKRGRGGLNKVLKIQVMDKKKMTFLRIVWAV